MPVYVCAFDVYFAIFCCCKQNHVWNNTFFEVCYSITEQRRWRRVAAAAPLPLEGVLAYVRKCVCMCVMYSARLGWCTWWPHINRMQKKKHEKQNKYMIVKSELDRQRRRPRQRQPTTHFTTVSTSQSHTHCRCIEEQKKKRAVVAANILHAAALSLSLSLSLDPAID